MNKQEKLLAMLKERYEHLIDLLVKTDQSQQSKKSLYQKNNQAIEASMAASLSAHQKNKAALDKHFQKLQASVKEILLEKLSTIDEEKDYAKAQYEKLVETIEESFENKISLNDLKRQKVKSTYDQKVKEATEAASKTEQKHEAKIQEASRTHNAHMERLLSETNELYEENDTIRSDAKINFDKAFKEAEKTKTQTLENIKKEQAAYYQSFKEALSALNKSYKAEKKPIEKEIQLLKNDQAKELKSIKDKYQKELNKLTSYKNEALKISDRSKASEYDKKIKHLKKTHQATLKEKESEHENTLAPELDKLDTFERDYHNKFKDLKFAAIDQIMDFLAQIDTANTENQMAIEKANTNYNLALNEHKAKKAAINIDYDIQSINFNQTLKENQTTAEHEIAISKPSRDITENEARFQQDVEINELDKAKKVATAKKEKDENLALQNHTLEETKLSLVHKRLNYLQDYDIEQIKLEKERQLINGDEKEETMLLSHYMKQSENYAALRSESVACKKPYVEALATQQKQDLDEMYNHMLSAAKQDHEAMIKKIKATYEKERKIYEAPLKHLKETHETILSDILKAHGKEREAIVEKLDNTTDKKRQEALKKELKELTENHDEIIRQKKKSLKQKEAGYEKMLADLKDYKNRSLEEAETLLYHITDQISLAQEENQKASERLQSNFDSSQNEINHRAKLFRTFQRQRQEETLKKVREQQNARLHQLNAKKQKSQTILEEQIKALESQFDREKQAIKDKMNQIEASYDKTLTDIEKHKEETYQTVLETYETEKDRLNAYQQKLIREYDQAMSAIKKEATAEKDDCFAKKDQVEAEKTREEQRLQSELNALLTDKEAEKQARIDAFKTRAQALKEALEPKIKTALDEKSLKKVEAIIKDEESIDVI